MSPATYISLARDIIVIAVIGFLAYLLVSFGENRVEKKDFQALEQRIKDNAATEARWRKEDTDANDKRDKALAALHADVSAPHAPIIVRVPVAQTPGLPAHPGEAGNAHPECAGTGSGHGGAGTEVDRRPDVEAFKLKYGTALIDCQAVLDHWPQ